MNSRASLRVEQLFDLPRRTPRAARAGHRPALQCAIAWAATILLTAIDAHAAEQKLGIGLYGSNGHQLSATKLAHHPNVQLVAALPFTLEEELHPLRLLLRAKEQMRAGAR